MSETTDDLRPHMHPGVDIIERRRWQRWRGPDGKYRDEYDLGGVEAERLEAADEIERLRALTRQMREAAVSR